MFNLDWDCRQFQLRVRFFGFLDKLAGNFLGNMGVLSKKFYRQFGKSTKISAVTGIDDSPYYSPSQIMRMYMLEHKHLTRQLLLR